MHSPKPLVKDEQHILKNFTLGKMLMPVVIGLGITALLIWRTADVGTLERIQWTWSTSFWLLLALLSLVMRDWMYMVRIRHLTGRKLTWMRAFVVIMLWEFASALAPGMIGGGFFFAIWFLSREGIDTGTSITVITFTSFLDGIFLAVMAPLVYFLVGHSALFEGTEFTGTFLGKSIFMAFWTVYFIILAYKLFVAYALFVNPVFVKRALVGLFSAPLLRRWRRSAVTTGDQLIVAAKGLKHQGWSYWWPALATTFASWTARYSIVNCILHAFPHGIDFSDLVVYGKQVVMGIIVLLSPTPGGSGLAEFIFNDFLGMYVAPGLAPAIALLWRLLSYYPYILIGAILLPRWVRRNVLAPLAQPGEGKPAEVPGN
ncbi:MAG: flippase-like domain-containing protein [Flavobacteriales bacterium]|nr:flippase-like domain-containing protein [Flavobacteriales bacterium]MEB2340702.1 lysylphosphatidylglycerol synthase transmembrane domain-containing protein [Flavobacteriia bacterium]